jgi:hypothetical protein
MRRALFRRELFADEVFRNLGGPDLPVGSVGREDDGRDGVGAGRLLPALFRFPETSVLEQRLGGGAAWLALRKEIRFRAVRALCVGHRRETDCRQSAPERPFVLPLTATGARDA